MANKLVARLCLMFGPPDVDNTAAWFTEMDRLVRNYSDAELDKAADIVLRSHRGKSFPSVSEMLTACSDARDLLPKQEGIEEMTPEKADFLAKKIVNGFRHNSRSGKTEPADGEFAEKLHTHPLVRQSVVEGWDRELRLHLLHVLRRHFMARQSFTSIDVFMPNREWVAAAREQAERFKKSAEWQKQNLPGSDMSVWLAKLMESNRRRNEDEAA